VRQSDGEVSETIVTLGKQLSRRWYVGYERGVNSTVGTWQLIYRVAQRFTLRAQSGAENSLDVIWVWRVP
jgi:translocation and assembly module TamB